MVIYWKPLTVLLRPDKNNPFNFHEKNSKALLRLHTRTNFRNMNHLHHPPIYFLLTTGVGFGLGRWIDPPFHFPHGVWVFSLLLSLVGLLIGAGSIIQFKLKHTAVRPFHESSALVDNGIYRLTRNPMYLALLLT